MPTLFQVAMALLVIVITGMTGISVLRCIKDVAGYLILLLVGCCLIIYFLTDQNSGWQVILRESQDYVQRVIAKATPLIQQEFAELQTLPTPPPPPPLPPDSLINNTSWFRRWW